MSTIDSTSTPLYPEVPVDREATINLVHGLQVDLSLLAAMLAREPEPTLHQNGIAELLYLRRSIAHFIPDTRRH
jgi:hypothetical protein